MTDTPASDTVPVHESSPPTYEGLPLIGNTHQLVREQGGLFEQAAAKGDVVRLRLLGMGDLYLVSHPDLVSDPDIDLSVSITTRPIDPIEMCVEPRDEL